MSTISEDDSGELAAIEAPIRHQDVPAEGGRDLLERRLPWLDDLAGQLIGIDDVSPQLGEHRCHHRLAGTDPPGKAQDLHFRPYDYRR